MVLPLALLPLALPLALIACGDPGAPGRDTGPVEVDADGDGWPQGEDCDDADPAVHPGAEELCNQQDDDCDARADEGLPTAAWYPDLDGDGFGEAAGQLVTCMEMEGWVTQGTDCDDLDPTVHPDAAELCDGLDQDCDEEIDEDLPLYDWWLDLDGDGFGDPAGQVEACAAPAGFVDNGDDCDDDDPSAWPGALEDWTDETDSDCDGEVETAGPVTLTGATVQQVHFTLPADQAVRIVSVQGPGTVDLHVDLAQPTHLVLIGRDVRWSVEDSRGTVADVTEVVADAVATTLDHPLLYDQRQAVEAAVGEAASWHGTAGPWPTSGSLTLTLSDLDAWPGTGGWPDCERPLDEGVLGPATLGVLECPGLGAIACLTATEDALVAFDLDGHTCTVQALPAPPSGATIMWSGGHALLGIGAWGALARVDLTDGDTQRAWLWPQATLHDGTQALLVPGSAWAGLDPDIVYAYESWADMQCGSGSNLTGVWADQASPGTILMGQAWWAEDGALYAIELTTGGERRLSVVELSEVRGLAGMPDGSLGVLVDGALWVVDPMSGVVRETVELEVEGVGLDCAG